MAKLVFGMMLSLDGYVAGVEGGPQLPPPGEELSRYFNEYMRGVSGILNGRRMYEVMRYWDEDQPGWDPGDHEFAAIWRSRPKWVVSRSLKSLGPNATLVDGDVETFVRDLNANTDGQIDVAGPELAGSLGELGLVDEYHMYFRPFVLGSGKPFFARNRPQLTLVNSKRVGEDTVLLKYRPSLSS